MEPRPLRVGIVGLGTVGQAVVRRLTAGRASVGAAAGRKIEIGGVSARVREKARDVDMAPFCWFDDPLDLARSKGIDVFVELIGGADGVAREGINAAIAAGKSVVTANKALLAAHGDALFQAAQAADVALNFEAAIAGGIPAVKMLREALTGNTISRVFGILNGTCNYILTRMEAEEDLDFDTCLAQAQALGYAEADPGFDVDGHDAAHKLALLTSLAFGTRINAGAVYCDGIRAITQADIRAARELGYGIKLLGVAQRTDTGIEQRVHLAMVPAGSAIAQIAGVTNAVAINSDLLGELVFMGPGAGGDATASAVIADLIDLARGVRVHPLGRSHAALAPFQAARMRAHEGGYYIRINLLDKPGALAAIARRMAQQEISLRNIVQRQQFAGEAIRQGGDETNLQPVIMITHATSEAAVHRALDGVRDDGYVTGEPHMIRIEQLAASQ